MKSILHPHNLLDILSTGKQRFMTQFIFLSVWRYDEHMKKAHRACTASWSFSHGNSWISSRLLLLLLHVENVYILKTFYELALQNNNRKKQRRFTRKMDLPPFRHPCRHPKKQKQKHTTVWLNGNCAFSSSIVTLIGDWRVPASGGNNIM